MEILNQTVVQVPVDFYINFHHPGFIIASIICVIGIVFLITESIQDHILLFGIVFSIAILFICFGLSMSLARTPIYQEVTQYEVTINSDTNFYDILDNYDIVEQRGKIFVLQDK